MTIGERIKTARKSEGLTQKQLGELSGTSEITVRQYERGTRQPRIEQLKRIADVLGVSAAYLLVGDEIFSNSSTHLANGVHIYKNTFPFKSVEAFLQDQSADSYDISYQDEYLIIAVDKDAKVTPEELEKIIDIYAPYREKTPGILLKDNERRIKIALDKLNDAGQQKAVERVEELTEIPKYTKRFEALTPEEKHLAETGRWGKLLELQFGLQPPQDSSTAPSEGKDTTSPENPPEGPQEGK